MTRRSPFARALASLLLVGACAGPAADRHRALDRDLAAAGRRGPVDDGRQLFAGQATLALDALAAAVLERNPGVEAARAAWAAATARYAQETSLEDPRVSYTFAPLSVQGDMP